MVVGMNNTPDVFLTENPKWVVLYIMDDRKYCEDDRAIFPDVHGIYHREEDALAFVRWAGPRPDGWPRYWVKKVYWRDHDDR
jgi:hypothetical protein